jgi:hypothetical protein
LRMFCLGLSIKYKLATNWSQCGPGLKSLSVFH